MGGMRHQRRAVITNGVGDSDKKCPTGSCKILFIGFISSFPPFQYVYFNLISG